MVAVEPPEAERERAVGQRSSNATTSPVRVRYMATPMSTIRRPRMRWPTSSLVAATYQQLSG